MLRLWPDAPKMTSSCATRPGKRTECTCTPSVPTAPRAPSSTTSVVGSGGSGGLPAERRAPAMAATVCDAVPVRRRDTRQVQQEHGADGEVGGHDGVGATPLEMSANGDKVCLGETAR